MPQVKFGTLGLMRADQIPDIHAIYVEKEELLPFAYGAKGIGEIATIPTAPAVQGAYYARITSCAPPCPWRIPSTTRKNNPHLPSPGPWSGGFGRAVQGPFFLPSL